MSKTARRAVYGYTPSTRVEVSRVLSGSERQTILHKPQRKEASLLSIAKKYNRAGKQKTTSLFIMYAQPKAKNGRHLCRFTVVEVEIQ